MNQIYRSQIADEWQKAGVKITAFTNDDITSDIEMLMNTTHDETEATTIFIYALRKAKVNGWGTHQSIKRELDKWILAGLTTGDEVLKFETEANNPKSAVSTMPVREHVPDWDNQEVQTVTAEQEAHKQELFQWFAWKNELSELGAYKNYAKKLGQKFSDWQKNSVLVADYLEDAKKAEVTK